MGEPAFVAGSIGPSGALFRPIGTVDYAQTGLAAAEQAEALAEAGVDLLVFETFTNLDEIVHAIAAVQRVCDLPIVAQLSFEDHHRTASGHDVGQVARALDGLDVAVIGVNCGVGPQQALDLLRQLAAASTRLLAAQPNAGYPVRLGGRVAYVATPEYFQDFAGQALAAGARLVGGCCGTTAAHVRAMRDVLRHDERPAVVAVLPVTPPSPVPEVAEEEPDTHLARMIARREFVVSVELDPPKGSNPAKALRGAEQLKEAGVDLINIGDSPMAKVRMSALGLALLIQQNVGLETMIHFTTRDRNLMAIQSDLLGAHALGIRHVIALTGDDLRASTNPPVKTVWDVDAIGLIAILNRLNQGTDYTGNSIGRPTRFLVACAVNPNKEDRDHELDRFRRKLDAGADFVMTQPLFSMEQLEQFHDWVGDLPIPHVMGLVPLESYRQAEFLHHEVPGFKIPADIRERMRQAGDHGAEEGLRIADEFVEQARPHLNGVYIITSYGRYDAAIALTRKLATADMAVSAGTG
jgi:methionine synthase / methylenetetrahydrofolate reductase(NADPH)